ncbi:MAG: bifunctional 5,10-methylenetetrahydrofolate dehydrogenase/5,10-methenyltetrahydrofolate cyclohydrolase [Lachnospiraceae bacterium]|nr:bifunctional 5,10-methylenetetrahydrofolate dehydrogenase/5,10-methenyltetrahydrofolate cyclohydrolase [Lachnospiraceae bacterium]
MAVIKGKPVADSITAAIREKTEELKNNGIVPLLTIVRVGERGDDIAYERAALKRMEMCGIAVSKVELPADITQADFEKELVAANESDCDGILLFMPLPDQLDESRIRKTISPEKDVDGVNPVNSAKLYEGDKTGFVPCTAQAVIEMIEHYGIETEGKKAVVLGRSLVIGRPVSIMLTDKNATVTVCHSRTKEIENVTAAADIVVAAMGRSKIVKADWIKKGAALFDVGINVDEDGNMTGDIDFESCEQKAGYITPVPAGVGGVTTSVLAKQVLKACMLRHGIQEVL